MVRYRPLPLGELLGGGFGVLFVGRHFDTLLSLVTLELFDVQREFRLTRCALDSRQAHHAVWAVAKQHGPIDSPGPAYVMAHHRRSLSVAAPPYCPLSLSTCYTPHHNHVDPTVDNVQGRPVRSHRMNSLATFILFKLIDPAGEWHSANSEACTDTWIRVSLPRRRWFVQSLGFAPKCSYL